VCGGWGWGGIGKKSRPQVDFPAVQRDALGWPRLGQRLFSKSEIAVGAYRARQVGREIAAVRAGRGGAGRGEAGYGSRGK
jgi:hypothetical protein